MWKKLSKFMYEVGSVVGVLLTAHVIRVQLCVYTMEVLRIYIGKGNSKDEGWWCEYIDEGVAEEGRQIWALIWAFITCTAQQIILGRSNGEMWKVRRLYHTSETCKIHTEYLLHHLDLRGTRATPERTRKEDRYWYSQGRCFRLLAAHSSKSRSPKITTL